MSLRDFHKSIARDIWRDRDHDAGAIVMVPLVLASLIVILTSGILIGGYLNSFLYGLLAASCIALACWYGLLILGAYYNELVEELKKDGKL